LTLRDNQINQIDQILDHYKDVKVTNSDEKIKFTSAYILYEITQVMLEKMFRVIKNIGRDIKQLEKEVFEKPNSFLVKDIMIKKRNIVVLMHMFKPQINVLKQIE
jgi:Mg2+ and Co2+ transporter CorA